MAKSLTDSRFHAVVSRNVQIDQEPERSSDAMADMHLSGSDPRMFPGIFTRGSRGGSARSTLAVDDRVEGDIGNTMEDKPSQ